jgi:hypothetical protein
MRTSLYTYLSFVRKNKELYINNDYSLIGLVGRLGDPPPGYLIGG